VPLAAFSESERLAAFHASQRDRHRDMAEAHRQHGQADAERQHRAAAAAHEAAMATPMDTFSAEVAMQASNRADQASLAPGVNRSTCWPPG
jgi:D-aminopeptidase